MAAFGAAINRFDSILVHFIRVDKASNFRLDRAKTSLGRILSLELCHLGRQKQLFRLIEVVPEPKERIY